MRLGRSRLYLAEARGNQCYRRNAVKEQHAIANERAAEKGLRQHARFLLEDYRDIHQRFDRIVSVGMFEHVGVSHYDAFFQKCAELLTR